MAHELHHVGYSQNCGGGDRKGKAAHRTKAGQSARNWLSAFGEGLAMLAAAGGPDVHPHAVSLPEERARWDRDVLRVNEDFAKLESFFVEIVAGGARTFRSGRRRFCGRSAEARSARSYVRVVGRPAGTFLPSRFGLPQNRRTHSRRRGG